MNKILLLCVLVTFSFETVGAAECLSCPDVGRDNWCKKKAYVCKGRYCFIQRFQKDMKIEKIMRGCASSCKTGVTYKKNRDIFLWCCSSNNCNSMNAWF